ncbi:MAG: hypothetical protein K8S99_06360 [Planctomycetes bacterium]|nr:hypothetical protein [Planctomycetota bacterium]
MSQRILDLFRKSGDASLGQTLIRLAALAEAAHRHEAAVGRWSAVREDAPLAGNGAGAPGFNPTDRVGDGSRRSAGPAGSHTEVRP